MNEDRKLAHIEVISEIRAIDGADYIEMVKVLGWECVAKKGEFKVGERIIFVEVDSILPAIPEFEFLRDRKFRIKTIKLRKQISQGLVLPISYLKNEKNFKKLQIGDDVTDALHIKKYLTPSEIAERNSQALVKHWTKRYAITKWLWRYLWFRNLVSPIKVHGFPSWISKTDEERIQNMPAILQKCADHTVYVTEKIDYQSATFTSRSVLRKYKFINWLFKPKFELIVCSRNHKTNDKNSLYWKIAQKYNIEQILRENPNLTIQGEQGDIGVQGNKYGISEPTLWVFNVIDHVNHIQYNWQEMSDFCQKYNLQTVPFIKICKLSEIGTSVADLVEYSKGKSQCANIQREGVVIRCIEDGKLVFSFKVINPNFLLEYDSN